MGSKKSRYGEDNERYRRSSKGSKNESSFKDNEEAKKLSDATEMFKALVEDGLDKERGNDLASILEKDKNYSIIKSNF